MPVSIMAGAMDEVDPAKEKLMADMSLPCVLRPILRDVSLLITGLQLARGPVVG